MTEGNHKKNHNQFGQNWDSNSELSEYKSSVMNFDWHCALCIQKLYHRHISQLGGAETSYCENSGSPASSCIMRRHYSIMYTQLLNAINGLLAVGLEWETYFVDAPCSFYHFQLFIHREQKLCLKHIYCTSQIEVNIHANYRNSILHYFLLTEKLYPQLFCKCSEKKSF